MSIITIKGPLTPDEIRRITSLMQDIESMRPDEIFEQHIDASDIDGDGDAILAAMSPPPLPGYRRTERKISPVAMITDAIRTAVDFAPTDASADQVIADTVAALWPAQPQGVDQ